MLMLKTFGISINDKHLSTLLFQELVQIVTQLFQYPIALFYDIFSLDQISLLIQNGHIFQIYQKIVCIFFRINSQKRFQDVILQAQIIFYMIQLGIYHFVSPQSSTFVKQSWPPQKGSWILPLQSSLFFSLNVSFCCEKFKSLILLGFDQNSFVFVSCNTFFLILYNQNLLGNQMAFNPKDFASAYVTQEEVLEIKKAFDLFDRDLGGAIDPKELKVAINSLGIEAKAQAVYQMIAELDKDGSGQIEFAEFFSMMTTRPSDNESREEVHKVFITFDPQKTGYVALKDLRKVAKDLGELTDDNILQEMIERADFDRDGVVSEEEFYNLITKKAH